MADQNSLPPRLHDLLERVCDQTASADEVAELDGLLRSDEAARAYYLRYLSLHCSLQTGAGEVPDSSADECGICVADFGDLIATRRNARRWTIWGLAAAAALVAVLTTAASYWNGQGQVIPDARDSFVAVPVPPSSHIARVTRLSDDIIWQSPNESIALNSHVNVGDVLQLTRGEMRLTYGTGVELRLLAPAEFVVNAAGGRLVRGGVRAVVPEQGRGFTIETPNGKVVDLGTEFGVAVDDFGVSEVSVYQGTVDTFADRRGGAPETVRLRQGEALQWNSEALVRLAADATPFDAAASLSAVNSVEDDQLLISEDFQARPLGTSDWHAVGDVETAGGALQLRNANDPTRVPYLVTTREFAPNSGPITLIADIRFTDAASQSVPSFSLLTRSSKERDTNVAENRQTMLTCVRCSFKSVPDSSSGAIEVATKLDSNCPLSNKLWRGFDQLERNVPYRLVMTDDGINVKFTVSLRDDPSVNKTVTCRSLFRGKENFVVLEGPVDGTIAIDRIQLFQDTAAKSLAHSGALRPTATLGASAKKELVANRLAALAPSDATLIVSDDFDGDSVDRSRWRTLGDVELVDGRIRLGLPNAQEHINTYKGRPYLMTRKQYTPSAGMLTIVGVAEFETNFLDEYGGSFAVMTRAADRRGKGPGWEYSILQSGVRANFWPAAWGQQHSLEIHEKPSPNSLSLLVAEGLEINPESREYIFKASDDGERVTLEIQDVQDPAISKTIAVPTSSSLKDGHIGFEACWGCPVWIDNVRIYRTP